jgi:hypothetical protein
MGIPSASLRAGSARGARWHRHPADGSGAGTDPNALLCIGEPLPPAGRCRGVPRIWANRNQAEICRPSSNRMTKFLSLAALVIGAKPGKSPKPVKCESGRLPANQAAWESREFATFAALSRGLAPAVFRSLGAAQNRSRASPTTADGDNRVNEKDVISVDKVVLADVENREVLSTKQVKHGMTVAPAENDKRVFQTNPLHWLTGMSSLWLYRGFFVLRRDRPPPHAATDLHPCRSRPGATVFFGPSHLRLPPPASLVCSVLVRA